ncbi:MAG: hypothetical protein P0S94_01405 [Simkaniaceae bacterium]|nr:hypothetical protein [Simkaniaceae bacterium]
MATSVVNSKVGMAISQLLYGAEVEGEVSSYCIHIVLRVYRSTSEIMNRGSIDAEDVEKEISYIKANKYSASEVAISDQLVDLITELFSKHNDELERHLNQDNFYGIEYTVMTESQATFTGLITSLEHEILDVPARRVKEEIY